MTVAITSIFYVQGKIRLSTICEIMELINERKKKKGNGVINCLVEGGFLRHNNLPHHSRMYLTEVSKLPCSIECMRECLTWC